MARRTKEDAMATRHSLLDAAEALFQERGVSRTSLQDIAERAGTSRGAIYWHFKDKADLFNAMMERVTLPLEQSLRMTPESARAGALQALRSATLAALTQMKNDAQLRCVVEVAMHKVEYVDDLHAVRERHLKVSHQCVGDIAKALRLAARQAGRRLPLPAEAAAVGLHALIDGLIHNWLLDPAAFDLPVTGRAMLDVYLTGLGLPADAAPLKQLKQKAAEAQPL